MKVLVINAGSSSLKYQVIDMENEVALAQGLVERIGLDGSKIKQKASNGRVYEREVDMKDHAVAVEVVKEALTDPEKGIIKSLEEIGAVGHRVVHGGEQFSKSVVIDDEVKAVIKECSKLAPLHNPANLTAIEVFEAAMPGVPMVAVFDTAFHQGMPKEAYLYALPYELYEEDHIRKYGFHGTSHKYVSYQAAKMLGRPIEDIKLITCHLGNGASLAAVKGGVSVDTSMGFTPLMGVVMGTRSGLLDPAIVTYLMENKNMSIAEINNLMNKESGMLGVSGVSSDFRDVYDAAENGNERAKIALDMFAYSIKKYIGLYAAVLDGADAIVFTAGVGENSGYVREKIVETLGFMGVAIDKEKNMTARGAVNVSAPGARVATLVIPTNEELMIARDTVELI